MTSLLRISFRAPRAHLFTYSTRLAPRRFASTDYGSKQSGHEQGINEDNPKKHLEHPGPEPPATKGQGQSSESKGGASPAIHQPSSGAEEQDLEVKKHNEEMKNRADKSANQLSEEDNKVDKKFWKGT